MLLSEFRPAVSILAVVLFSFAASNSAFCRAPSGPWDTFNYASSSKTVYPAAIHSSQGSVDNPQLLVNNSGSATLSGKGSWVALDFGVEVGGLISLTIIDTNTTSPLASPSHSDSPNPPPSYTPPPYPHGAPR